MEEIVIGQYNLCAPMPFQWAYIPYERRQRFLESYYNLVRKQLWLPLLEIAAATYWVHKVERNDYFLLCDELIFWEKALFTSLTDGDTDNMQETYISGRPLLRTLDIAM
jgi:hypothetical protein